MGPIMCVWECSEVELEGEKGLRRLDAASPWWQVCCSDQVLDGAHLNLVPPWPTAHEPAPREPHARRPLPTTTPSPSPMQISLGDEGGEEEGGTGHGPLEQEEYEEELQGFGGQGNGMRREGVHDHEEGMLLLPSRTVSHQHPTQPLPPIASPPRSCCSGRSRTGRRRRSR